MMLPSRSWPVNASGQLAEAVDTMAGQQLSMLVQWKAVI